MLLLLEHDADLDRVKAQVQRLGAWTAPMQSGRTRALAIVPPSPRLDAAELAALVGVAEVLTGASRHPRVDAQAMTTVAGIGAGAAPVLMAGPCGVETRESISEIARLVAKAGGGWLRGGAYKPRTSPYAFAGHGPEALVWLRAAADANGLRVVTEVLSEHHVDGVAALADLLQVGSRNMHNFALLKAVGGAEMPVMLKRGASATIDEWLLAGEHLLAAGADGVVFCERGVRSFDPTTRNLLDLGAAAHLAHALGQPVIVDPSHACGRRDLIESLSHAALGAGAHGLLVEVHTDPGAARSDGPQAVDEALLHRIGDAVAKHGGTS